MLYPGLFILIESVRQFQVRLKAKTVFKMFEISFIYVLFVYTQGRVRPYEKKYYLTKI